MAIIKHPEQRVGVFIDTQNLYHSAKNLYHARVNFGNVLKDSLAGRRLVRARAYAVTTESGEEKAFFEALGKVGIEMRLKDLQVFSGGAKKADWDVGLAVDAITASPKLDTVIIFTGDGDFVPLVQYLQMHAGCQVEVVSFGRSTSLKLKEAADDFLDLDEEPKRYLINYRGPSIRRTGSARNANRESIPENDLSDADASREAADIGRITGVE
ncbi:NYN domain-containing protein [Candidatus Parcubacteria bacterium]|nr:MAG: NYN domain-containing protein [Candidatus Parcubacteria bacterium]